jgi:hypothetical protein
MRDNEHEPISRHTGRWVMAAVLAVLFGFSAAATAITLKHPPQSVQAESGRHTLPANFAVRPWSTGFEDALY